MRCVSAFAAMTVIVLGTPAIAMAGTLSPRSGSGPGGGPGQVRIACALPPGQHVRPRLVRVRLHGRRHHVRLCCRPLVFDVAPGASTLTEVSGPVLAPPEVFRYQGQTYTIMSVNPGAGTFTVFRGGMLFVNHGPAITRALAVMACTARTVRQIKILT